jgi:hypothetical protein
MNSASELNASAAVLEAHAERLEVVPGHDEATVLALRSMAITFRLVATKRARRQRVREPLPSSGAGFAWGA